MTNAGLGDLPEAVTCASCGGRTTAPFEHAERYGHAVSATTTEYRPVLLCRDGSRCVTLYPENERRHVLDRVTGQPYTDRQDAIDHANGMRWKVYGTEHDVVIETREVSPWTAEA
jgi:hypothetical protein